MKIFQYQQKIKEQDLVRLIKDKKPKSYMIVNKLSYITLSLFGFMILALITAVKVFKVESSFDNTVFVIIFLGLLLSLFVLSLLLPILGFAELRRPDNFRLPLREAWHSDTIFSQYTTVSHKLTFILQAIVKIIFSLVVLLPISIFLIYVIVKDLFF